MSQKERKRLSLVAERSDGIVSVQTEDKSENVSTASAEIAGTSVNPWYGCHSRTLPLNLCVVHLNYITVHVTA